MPKNNVSGKASTGKIRAKIDIPGITVDIHTKDSASALREVRKILETLRMTTTRVEEDVEDIGFEQRPQLWALSDEARNNQEFMEFIHLAATAEEHFTYKRLAITNRKIIDVEARTAQITVDMEIVKAQLRSVIPNPNKIAYAAVHVMGVLPQREKHMICDMIGEHLGRVDMKSTFTDKDILGKTIVELALFGKDD